MKPEVIKHGSGLVKVYTIQNGPYTSYQLYYRLAGKLYRPKFSNKEEALREAGEKARMINSGQVVGLSLDNRDATDYLSAKERLAPYGISVGLAVEQYIEARKLMGSLPFLDTIQKAVKREASVVEVKRPADIVDQFIATKKKENVDYDYVRTLTTVLSRFGDDFQIPFSELQFGMVRDWLLDLKSARETGELLSDRTRHNYFSIIKWFLKYAYEARFLPRDVWDDFAEKTVGDTDPGEIEIWTPDEMRKLLKAADEHFKVVLVLGGFAGMRTTEITLLTWADIHFKCDEPHVELPDGKTGGRIVPLGQTACAWLKELPKQEGPLVTSVYHFLEKTATKAKIAPWKHNALRHSFISYRAAITKDLASLAFDCGTSVTTIKKHYLKPSLKGAAMEYFKILPDGAAPLELPANVVEMRGVA